jgi:N-acetylglucosaminyldiphosphoundecaprenol N-acetyl-beta-D-mannosaminyltransferase
LWGGLIDVKIKGMVRKKVDILGVKIDRVGFEEAVKRVERMIGEGGKHYIVTPNPEFVVLAQKDKGFKKILNQADLAVADGIGLLAAAKFLKKGSKFKNRLFRIVDFFFFGLEVGWWVLVDQKKLDVLPERVSGIDLVWEIAKYCRVKGLSIALLGSKKGVADKAAKCLKEKFPHLKISGTWDGKEADRILLGKVPKISAGILLVAFGHLKQEEWIAENLKDLDVRIAIGVGGSFDFLVGRPKRAPLIVRQLGLEWTWRLIQQPRRWRRIVIAFPYFPLLIFWNKIRGDLQGEELVVK